MIDATRAAALRWLLLDVDGVLTNGRLYYTADGESLKPFHVRDGLAIKLARQAGLSVGLLSGRRSPPLERRAADLSLDVVLLGVGDKGKVFTDFLTEHQVQASDVAFIGDDLIDLPVLGRCGLALAPADAVAEVRERVDVVLSSRGGEGAVREAVELLLRARGMWNEIVDRFLPEP
ncbi:MAG: HAD hydrolase family protein [Acidobacteriota bacterium]